MLPREPIVGLVEPWYGESHATFIDGVAAHCGLDSAVVKLPAEKWQWRMRMGAWPLKPLIEKLDPWPAVFLFSDYVNLSQLIGLVPRLNDSPKIVYFHENQLTYPLRRGAKRDFEFCAISVLSCLTADRCIFCSSQQLAAFLEGVPEFLQHDDSVDGEDIAGRIESKSSVIPVGVDLDRFDAARRQKPDRTDQPLRIVWPHRFEHDKNPDDFFEVLTDLHKEDLPFEVSVVGKSPGELPPSMVEAKARLKGRIVEWGFLEGIDYANALAAADVVVSTAWQETQGLAVIEAIRAGCDPLLPNRLSYPEVLGEKLREGHLYQNKGELKRRLRRMMRNPEELRATSRHHAEMDRFSWEVVGPQFGELLESMIRQAEKGT